MPPPNIDPLLQQFIADRRVTGSEKKVLRDWLDLHKPTEQQLGFFRHRVFAIARQEMTDPDSIAVLDWVEEMMRILVASSVGASNSPVAEASVGTAHHAETYFSPNPNCPKRIASLFDQARKSVDVCVFTITDDRIARPILAAHRRGVKIRIISDNDKAKDPGSDIDEFRKYGIDVRLDASVYHMHHKFAIFDGLWLLNGSYNWTRGAAENNQENFIVTRDPILVQAFQNEFENLWKRFG